MKTSHNEPTVWHFHSRTSYKGFAATVWRRERLNGGCHWTVTTDARNGCLPPITPDGSPTRQQAINTWCNLMALALGRQEQTGE